MGRGTGTGTGGFGAGATGSATALPTALALLRAVRDATAGSWSMHVKSWADLAGDRVLVLRYEDLLAKPGKHFARAARLLGLGQDRARIERAVRHATFQSLASLEQKHGFVEARDSATRFFRAGRMNQWRDVLSRDQLQRMVAAHREQMARFDYLPPGY